MKARHLVLVALFAVPAMGPAAQSPTAFDVVSIKRSLSTESGGGSVMLPGGRFTAANVPLVLLLDVAYGIPPERIVGGPAWIRTDRYSIEARTGRDASPDETPQMVQTMLRERFQLKSHVDKRDTPVYALVAGNAGVLGPGLRPAVFNCSDMQVAKKGLATVSADGIPGCGDRRAPGRFLAGDLPLSALEDVLAPAVGRPVLNRTGIAGRFDIKLEWTPDSGAPNGVSIFTAVREQLGLRLENQTAPLDTLVVDSVQRPTEN